MDSIISKKWIVLFRKYLGILSLVTFIAAHYSHYYQFQLPTIIFSIILFFILSNIFIARSNYLSSSENFVFLLVLLDLLIIYTVLLFSGGASNPFSILFLVYVVFSAIIFKPLKIVSIVTLSIVAFGSLLIIPSSHSSHHSHHSADFSSHLWGMWIAYSLVSILCSFTITILTKYLKESLEQTEKLKNKQLRLSSLTTLAAGAAHELRTPINTISLCIEDAKYAAKKLENSSEISDQLEIATEEIARCVNIIKNLSLNSGEIEGENLQTINLKEFCYELANQFPNTSSKQIKLTSEIPDSDVSLPYHSVKNALKSLIQNSLESAANVEITISAWVDKKFIYFKVVDTGPGIDQTTLNQLGEPFITTKPTGSGMGLGVFLAKLTATTYGGNLDYKNDFSSGTEVCFYIKRN